MSVINVTFRVTVTGRFRDGALPMAEKSSILHEKLDTMEDHILETFDEFISDDIAEILNGFETDFTFEHNIDVAEARQAFTTTTKVVVNISTEDIVPEAVHDEVRNAVRAKLDGMFRIIGDYHEFDGTDAPNLMMPRNEGEGDARLTGMGVIVPAFGLQNGGRRRRGRRMATKKRRSATRKNKRRGSKKTRKSSKKRRFTKTKRRV